MFSFADLSPLANGGIFAAGATLVWLAGAKLRRYVDLFADRTGIGKASATASGELWSVGHVGLWPITLVVFYIFTVWVIYRYDGNPRWEPSDELAEPPESALDLKDAFQAKYADTSTTALIGFFTLASTMVFIGGSFVAKTGEAIAEQTGIGQNFVGATLVALATSLPEISTTYSAVQFGAYSMAAANILGTNSFEIALFLPADLAYFDDPIFNAMDSSDGFLAALGILVTSLYLWGILERRDFDTDAIVSRLNRRGNSHGFAPTIASTISRRLIQAACSRKFNLLT